MVLGRAWLSPRVCSLIGRIGLSSELGNTAAEIDSVWHGNGKFVNAGYS
jgi:hypothetical protein